MRLRARHLAYLLVLLSSLRVAQAAPLRTGDHGLGGHYVAVLLQQVAQREAAASSFGPGHTEPLAPASISTAASDTARPMPPPAAHSALIQAVTARA